MSENVEPEHILLHADWSPTRPDEYPPDADVVEHERQRHEKLRRGRAPFMPPSSPEEAERLMDAEIAEHADRTVEFLLHYEAALPPTDGPSAGPASGVEAGA